MAGTEVADELEVAGLVCFGAPAGLVEKALHDFRFDGGHDRIIVT